MDERVLALAEPIAEDLGLRIVRIRVMAGKRKTVQIMAERLSDELIEAGQKAKDAAKLKTNTENPIANNGDA